ncbi:HB2L protein, partial [Rhabdornis inornatus]|nr:HB2L protein [Rhabdornis inornatus]
PPVLCLAHTGVFQFMGKIECHYINGTEKLRLVLRFIYNREEFLRFDSDVGLFVGFTPYGEIEAQHLNSKPEIFRGPNLNSDLEHYRVQVGTVCPHNYKIIAPFSVER